MLSRRSLAQVVIAIVAQIGPQGSGFAHHEALRKLYAMSDEWKSVSAAGVLRKVWALVSM